MELKQIEELQKDYGFSDMQEKINSGLVWELEGSYGRAAMNLLESGACFLPEERKIDYYGSVVPSRNDLKEGSKGTLRNSIKFWEKVENGEIDIFPIDE